MPLVCYDCRTNKYVIEKETAVGNTDDAVEVSAQNVASDVADAAAKLMRSHPSTCAAVVCMVAAALEQPHGYRCSSL